MAVRFLLPGQFKDHFRVGQRAAGVGRLTQVDQVVAFLNSLRQGFPIIPSRSKECRLITNMVIHPPIGGAQAGFLAAATDIIDRLKALQPPWSVNIMAQEAGRICLAQNGDYAGKTRRLIVQERERLSVELTRLGLKVFPSRANYLLLRSGSGHPPAGELSDRLSKELLLIRNCGNYRGLDERYFRVSVRLPKENDRLVAALENALRPV